MEMSSNRPYLVRAYYDWIVDNECTPHLIVDAESAGVEVPRDFVIEGQIVLNIAPRAVAGLLMNNTALSFNARFNGRPTDIYIPIEAVVGIYARENQAGIAFPAQALDDNREIGPGADQNAGEKSETDRDPPPAPGPGGPPRLRVVK